MLRSKHLLPISLLSLTAGLTLLNGVSVAFADELPSPSPVPSTLPSDLPSASPSLASDASTSPSPSASAEPSPTVQASPSPTPTDTTPSSPWVRTSSGIQFSSEVPFTQYQELSQDLEELSAVPISNPDSKLQSVMGLKDVSPQSLLGWLTGRVHFIVDENYNIEPQIIESGHVFPNADAIPVSYGGTDALNSTLSDSASGDILMGNLSSSYYDIAKQHGLLVSVYVQGVGDVVLNSPRSGILKVGPALFDGSALGASTDTELHNARRTLQLAVLFHEARHGDGHGAHLGFHHVTCPDGHAMAGLPACDANLNGPYSIQAHFLNSIERSCDQCSAREREILKMAALDNMSRVQTEIVDPAKDPVAIVKQTKILSSYCDGISDLGLQSYIPEEMAKECATLPQLKQVTEQIQQGKFEISTIPSTEWDPAPEGSFDPTTDIH